MAVHYNSLDTSRDSHSRQYQYLKIRDQVRLQYISSPWFFLGTLIGQRLSGALGVCVFGYTLD
jgi:hypothetical protein